MSYETAYLGCVFVNFFVFVTLLTLNEERFSFDFMMDKVLPAFLFTIGGPLSYLIFLPSSIAAICYIPVGLHRLIQHSVNGKEPAATRPAWEVQEEVQVLNRAGGKSKMWV